MRKHATGKKRKLYAQFLRFLPVAGLRFTFYAFYPDCYAYVRSRTIRPTEDLCAYVKNEPIVGLITMQHDDVRDVTNGLGSTNGGTLSGVPATRTPQTGHNGGTTKHATNDPGSQC